MNTGYSFVHELCLLTNVPNALCNARPLNAVAPSLQDCSKLEWFTYYFTEATSAAFQMLYNNTDGELASSTLHHLTCEKSNTAYLSRKDTPNIEHLSNEDTVCCPQPHRAVYKSTSELGTPLYTGQSAGSQWCPL